MVLELRAYVLNCGFGFCLSSPPPPRPPTLTPLGYCGRLQEGHSPEVFPGSPLWPRRAVAGIQGWKICVSGPRPRRHGKGSGKPRGKTTGRSGTGREGRAPAAGAIAPARPSQLFIARHNGDLEGPSYAPFLPVPPRSLSLFLSFSRSGNEFQMRFVFRGGERREIALITHSRRKGLGKKNRARGEGLGYSSGLRAGGRQAGGRTDGPRGQTEL